MEVHPLLGAFVNLEMRRGPQGPPRLNSIVLHRVVLPIGTRIGNKNEIKINKIK
jgi:hypothetical protein